MFAFAFYSNNYFTSGIKKGSTRKLCCDVALWEPLVYETLQIQWLYYRDPRETGGDNYQLLSVSAQCLFDVMIFLNM